jgi:hypothetical protein
MAPHLGHVPNFCGPNGTMIEPMDGYCFQTNGCELPPTSMLGTQSGHVSNSSREPRITSGMRRHAARVDKRWATSQE